MGTDNQAEVTLCRWSKKNGFGGASNEFEGEKRGAKVDVFSVVLSTEVVSDDCGLFGDDSTHRLSSSRGPPKRAFWPWHRKSGCLSQRRVSMCELPRAGMRTSPGDVL